MAKTPREGSCKVTERSFVVPETPPTSHSFQAQESLKKRFLRIPMGPLADICSWSPSFSWWSQQLCIQHTQKSLPPVGHLHRKAFRESRTLRFICQREMVWVGHGESRGIWAMFEQLRQRIEAGDQWSMWFGGYWWSHDCHLISHLPFRVDVPQRILIAYFGASDTLWYIWYMFTTSYSF